MSKTPAHFGRLYPLLITLSALLPIQPLRAADAPPNPPELAVLDKFVGEWTTESTVLVLDSKPQNLKTTGTALRKWALNKRIVEETGKSSDGSESRTIFGYDALKKQYRLWFFDSYGTALEMHGDWNDATQTFTLLTELGGGLTQASTVHFPDKDTQEWTSKVSDTANKVYFDGTGKLKRTK